MHVTHADGGSSMMPTLLAPSYTSTRGMCLAYLLVLNLKHAYCIQLRVQSVYPDSVPIINLDMWCVVTKGCSTHLAQCSQLVLRQSLQATETDCAALPKVLTWELSTALRL